MARASTARWLLISPALLIFWAVANIDKLSISIIFTNQPFLRAMGIAGNPAAIGFLLTAFVITYGVFNFLWGFIVDRIGPRRSAVVAVSVWGVAMVLGGLSSSYGMMLFSRILLGAGEGSLYAVANKFVGNWFHWREKGRAQGMWVIGGAVGPAVGAPIIVAAMIGMGWQAPFFVLAAISLIISLPFFIFLTRDLPEQMPAANEEERAYIAEGQRLYRQETAANHGAALHQVLSNWRYWVLVVAYGTLSVTFFGLVAWLPTYLVKARHFSPTAMGAWTSVAWVLAVLAILVAGFLTDATHRPGLIGAIGYLLIAAGLFTAAGTSSAGLAAFAASLGLGVVNGLNSLANIILHRFAGQEVVGRSAGIMTGVGNFFGAFAPTFIGFLVGAAGGSFVPALHFLVGAAIFGAVALLVVSTGEVRMAASTTAPAAPAAR